MTVRTLIAMGVLLIAGAPSHAQDDEKETWRIEAVPEENQSVLNYGTGNAEVTPIAFVCKIRSGTVEALISETDESLKTGQTVTASLSAGRTAAKVRGRMMPNEEAGVPSFSGKLPATDPLFGALSQSKTLVMAIGRWTKSIPLGEMGDKANQFVRACRRR